MNQSTEAIYIEYRLSSIIEVNAPGIRHPKDEQHSHQGCNNTKISHR